MSKQNSHTNTFTSADILRYHAGILSATERHALEKAALEDPFLADAIEGFALTSTPEKDLEEVKKRLLHKTEKGEVVPFAHTFKRAIRVAALLLLVLTAGWGIYQLSNHSTKEIGLQNGTNKVRTPAPVVEDSTFVATETSESVRDENAAGSQKTAAATKRSAPTAAKAANEGTVLEVQSTAVPTSQSSGNNRTNDIAQVKSNELAPPEAISLQKALEGKVAGITVTGQVTDASGTPVPNASVVQPTTRLATITDINGRFQMALRDTASPIISAAGFQPQKLALTNNTAENKVVLQQSNEALAEVVVTGYEKARRKSASAPLAQSSTASSNLEPAAGWANFEKYVSEKLRPAVDANNKKIMGEVVLSFEVNKRGAPLKIIVEKSLCTKCDKEAIRLLQEGPEWKPTRGKRGNLSLRF